MSEQRRYTLDEIDRMRTYAECLFLYGAPVLPGGNFCSRSYSEPEKTIAVEQKVRTMMAAGVDPSECVVKDCLD